MVRKVKRKIIFECYVGSKLYGTNRPDSDNDYMGVFLPSTEESFGLDPFSSENSEQTEDIKVSTGNRNGAGDTDRKYYRIDKFLKMLMQGQSKQTEMLYCPENLIITKTPEWDLILSRKDMFLSKNSIIPFFKFAKKQALLAVIKGDNLKNMKELIALLETKRQNKTVLEEVHNDLKSLHDKKVLELKTLPDGVAGFEFVGRDYLLSQKVKDVVKKLKELESRYGGRSVAASENGYDFKSLSHAYRLLHQADYLLTHGKLQFPLEKDQVDFLKKVRSGDYDADYFTELDVLMKKLEARDNPFKDNVSREEVEELCMSLLFNHLMSNNNESLLEKILKKINSLFKRLMGVSNEN